MRGFLLAACLGVVSACTPLTARSPLFSPADTTGPSPLAEGVWMQVTAACRPEAATPESVPHGCVRSELTRLPDGAWRYLMWPTDDGDVRGVNQAPLEWRFVLAPATEQDRGSDYAPLYVAEYVAADDTTILYAMIVPVSLSPRRELVLIPMIECDEALAEGPLPGVEEEGPAGARGCSAETQRGVREAARRSLIENAGRIAGHEAIRFVYLGPSHPGAGIAESFARVPFHRA